MFKIANVSKKADLLPRYKILNHRSLKYKIKKLFTEKNQENIMDIKERHIFLLNDKYSVKPDKEIKITKLADGKYRKEIISFQPISFYFKDIKENLRRKSYRIFFPSERLPE